MTRHVAPPERNEPRPTRRALALLSAVVLVTATLTITSVTPASAEPTPVITSPDTAGAVGQQPSMQLDPDGSPVVAYEAPGGDIRILRCNDPACAGGDDPTGTLDTPTFEAFDPSLQLDPTTGNPVIAFYNLTGKRLVIVRCNDPVCAGSDDPTSSPDPSPNTGQSPSLQLDSAGYPVVAYTDSGNGDLKILHCNDPVCDGSGESITTPDGPDTVGANPSLQLDANDFPIIAHYDSTNGNLRVLRCNDLNCAGTGETRTTPDTQGTVGANPSLRLDRDGNPIVAYTDLSNNDLKLLRCDDPACAGSNDPSLAVDAVGDVGLFPSMELDRRNALETGSPVVAYFDATNADLKVLSYDDPGDAGLTAKVVITPTSGVCVSLDTTIVDFGGLALGVNGTTGPTTLTNCSVDQAVSLTGEVSGALLSGSPIWTPVKSTDVCTVGPNRFAYALDAGGGPTLLDDDPTALAGPALTPTATRTDLHTLFMPCPGSNGAPTQTITMNVLYTATAAA